MAGSAMTASPSGFGVRIRMRSGRRSVVAASAACLGPVGPRDALQWRGESKAVKRDRLRAGERASATTTASRPGASRPKGTTPMSRIVIADSTNEYDGRDLAGRPLGGTETSVIHLAEALARRGHDVACRTNTAA